MDLVEWMFGKFVKQRQNVRKTLEESSVAYAEDEIASLQILICGRTSLRMIGTPFASGS